MTMQLKLYICHECGLDFLFEADKHIHTAETGHRLFMVVELGDTNQCFESVRNELSLNCLNSNYALGEDDDILSFAYEGRKSSSINDRHALIGGHIQAKRNNNMHGKLGRFNSSQISIIDYPIKIDWHVTRRLLNSIYEEGVTRKTRLAMKGGVKCDACTRYLKWMEEVGWITIENIDNKYYSITLTPEGLKVVSRINSQR